MTTTQANHIVSVMLTALLVLFLPMAGVPFSIPTFIFSWMVSYLIARLFLRYLNGDWKL